MAQKIDAKRRHHFAAKMQPSLDRTDNGAYISFMIIFICAVIVGIVYGIYSFAGDFSLAYPVSAFTIALLGLVFSEGVHRVGMKHYIPGNGAGAQVTKTYDSLLPHNKELAAPLVFKIYELQKNGKNGIEERIDLLSKIKDRDNKEREANRANFDNSDIVAVESVLAGYEKLEG